MDYKIFSLINGLSGHVKLLDLFMIGMAKYGVILYGLILLYLWFAQGDTGKKMVFKAVASAFVALAINQVIGFMYFRPRPFAHHVVNMLIDKSPDPSFPSDHATGSSALTFSIIKTNPLVGILMSVLTVLLMVSRIYVGTHYPLDVFGGMITGIIGTMIINGLWAKFDKIADSLIDIYKKYIPA